MNTVYALILISSLGGVQEVYRFPNMDDCLATKTSYEEVSGNKAHCVSLTVRKKVQPSEIFEKFGNMIKDIEGEKNIEPTI